jgi:hypothetical protein
MCKKNYRRSLPDELKKRLNKIYVKQLKDLGNKLCTDPFAVRTYVWVILDVNSANFGNGSNPGGKDIDLAIVSNLDLTKLDDSNY